METSQNNKNVGCRESATFLVSILSLIVATCSMFISKCAVDKSEEIAERFGAFDKGKLNLKFVDYLLVPNEVYDVCYGIIFHDSIENFASFPTGVYNSGNKTVESENLLINYPHSMNVTTDDTLLKLTPLLSKDDATRKIVRKSSLDQVLMSNKSINPNTTIDTWDMIYIGRKTPTPYIVSVDPKTGSTKVKIASSLIPYPVVAILTARDIEKQTFRFVISYWDEANMDSLIKKVALFKISNENRSIALRSFFVITPDVNKKAVKGEKKEYYADIFDDVVLCRLEDDMQSLLILNSDGSIRKKIETKSL